MTYAEKLKDPRWQKKRLEIMRRDEWKCQLCGDQETTLHIHHKKYIKGKQPWQCHDDNLITLCEHCHSEVEDLIRETQVDFSLIRGCFKSKGWSSGVRMMFIAYDGKTSMRIYDKNENTLLWLNLSNYTMENIIDVFEKSIINGKTVC